MKSRLLKTTMLAGVLGMTAAFVGSAFADESLQDVMKRRNLTNDNLLAAAKTYTPTGGRDEFLSFASGGQYGGIIVFGIPSMRIIKYIAVFNREPWQGYGFDDESKSILASSKTPEGKPITWGDTHHPNLSKTNGDYDGQYLFINDKSTPRIAVIGLKDFETRQIVVNPILTTDHGGAFVTNNTEYVVEASQYPGTLDRKYQGLDKFNDYRGGITYWKFNRQKGMIEPENSFTIELPPYSQDLTSTGKGPSNDWSFTNSLCTERYVGGIESGRPPFEAGCSAHDTDLLHVINWKKAEAVFKAGKVDKINGMSVIRLKTAIDEGLLYLVPEPKSPHGVDVSPDGKFVIVSGKLDTHDSVYDFDKMQKLIEAKDFAGKDPYGIPILDMKKSLHVQVALGLGPLHNQFDSKPCIVYTSLYVDSQVVKWDYCEGKVLDKIPVFYNIGHLMTMEGDTEHPKGKYLVALNKLAIDRFDPVGPLHPQNEELIDISGDKMKLLYDMPLPLGEPHYAVAISLDKLKPLVRYKYGTNSRTEEASPFAVRPGSEHIDRSPGKVEVFGTVIRSHYNPEIVQAQEGDTVIYHWTNAERAEDETHGFAVAQHDVQLSLEPGKTASATIPNVKAGVYPYYCTEFCSALHLEMEGYLMVAPKGGAVAQPAAFSTGQTYTKADFDKQYKENLDTQAVIDGVVAYITSVNYKDFPTVVGLVTDATDQLNFAKDARAKADDYSKKGDWQNAMLWANQWWQYQVKAADIGLRAKTYLEQNGAKKVK
jgi:nitrous-oxide reductase